MQMSVSASDSTRSWLLGCGGGLEFKESLLIGRHHPFFSVCGQHVLRRRRRGKPGTGRSSTWCCEGARYSASVWVGGFVFERFLTLDRYWQPFILHSWPQRSSRNLGFHSTLHAAQVLIGKWLRFVIALTPSRVVARRPKEGFRANMKPSKKKKTRYSRLKSSPIALK